MRNPALLSLLLSLAACGGDGDSPMPEFSSDVEACRHQLREAYQAMVAMETESGWQPTRSGVGFFAEIISSGFWPDDDDRRSVLTCPGSNVPPGPPMSFADIEAVTGAHSSYAGRNLFSHPLSRFPTSGSEVLMACDNSAGMNHDGVMNVLYADGSVKTFELAVEIAAGRLTETATVIPVGSNATAEDLGKLSLD